MSMKLSRCCEARVSEPAAFINRNVPSDKE